jgi:hypothetical protein
MQWWAGAWQQGEHVLILGQTGSGKTTLERFLVQPRKWVIVPDAKAGDDNLDKWGYQRVDKWPLPYDMRENLRNKEPVHVIVGKVAKTKAHKEQNKEILARCMSDLWMQGRWTVVCDELQLLADRRFAGGQVGEDIEELLISARFRKISVVSTFQRPKIALNTPSASAGITQATYVFASMTRDTAVHDRLAEVVGRPKPEMRGLISGLRKFQWAAFSLDPAEPVRMVLPPKIEKMVPPAEAQQTRSSQFFWGELPPEEL